MSKESKPRDRWSQVYTAAVDRPATWCKSCGYYRVVHGVHRADCFFLAHRCRDCQAPLERAESVADGRCLECRLFGDGS